MRLLVSGSSGFIGSSLVSMLRKEGHSVARLVRSRSSGAGSTDGTEESIPWDPKAGILDTERLEGIEAVINLAGENLSSGLWTAARKKRLVASRVNSTSLLCERIATLHRRPDVILSASAIGIYGLRGDELLSEQSESAAGFLSDLCRAWEAATRAAQDAGIRVVHLRFGLVLDPAGGVLARMLPAFRVGLGTVFGDGDQYMSWISMADLLAMTLVALRDGGYVGPLNVVAPHPVTNREFTRTLAGTVGRRGRLRFPAGLLRLLLGSMAEETLLAGQRARPEKALQLGFRFRYPTLESALRPMLGS